MSPGSLCPFTALPHGEGSWGTQMRPGTQQSRPRPLCPQPCFLPSHPSRWQAPLLASSAKCPWLWPRALLHSALLVHLALILTFARSRECLLSPSLSPGFREAGFSVARQTSFSTVSLEATAQCRTRRGEREGLVQHEGPEVTSQAVFQRLSPRKPRRSSIHLDSPCAASLRIPGLLLV